jgi:hypothetical protein
LERCRGDAGVVQSAVGGGQGNAELLAKRTQVVAAGGGQQYRRQFVGVNIFVEFE